MLIESILLKMWPTKKYYHINQQLVQENLEKTLLLESLQTNLQEINAKLDVKINYTIDLEIRIANLLKEAEVKKNLYNQLLEENFNLEQQINRLEETISSLNANFKSVKSGEFWEENYKNGGTSGTGSYGKIAEFKAEVVNNFIKEKNIETTIEFGCGDGNQLGLIHYRNYTGIDISHSIIQKNQKQYKSDASKNFFDRYPKEKYMQKKYQLAISMDVIFHLLEDQIFEEYLNDLFESSEKYVIIYSSNHEEFTQWPEYRHRNFTGYIQNHLGNTWKLYKYIPNKFPYQIGNEAVTSASDFYIFQKTTQ